MADLSSEAQLTIVAIFAGPIIAVVLSLLITVWYQRWWQRRAAKQWVLGQAISYRHNILHEESVRALNQIDLVFSKTRKDAAVRRCWKEFVDAVRTEGVSLQDRLSKYNELITVMCEALGYGKAFSYLDATRVLFPAANNPPQLDPKARELQDEMLRVFKGSKAVDFVPLGSDEESCAGQ